MANHRAPMTTGAMLAVSARESLPNPRRTAAAALIVAAPITGGMAALTVTDAHAQAPASISDPGPAPLPTPLVVVRSGDTVSELARAAGVSTTAMLDLNGLGAFEIIRPGDELRLPAGATVRAVAPAQPVASPPEEASDLVQAPAASSSGSAALDTARSQIGVMYRFGGASPARGFDCSGLVMWAYAQHGVELPRTSTAMKSVGVEVSREDARPGDLVIFNGMKHVAMYAGDGRMVEAARAGKPVREREIWTPNVTFRRV